MRPTPKFEFHLENQPFFSKITTKLINTRMLTHTHCDRSNWSIEVVQSFEEAEEKTRKFWHSATSAERFEAAAQIKEIVYGKPATTARLQRFLEVVFSP